MSTSMLLYVYWNLNLSLVADIAGFSVSDWGAYGFRTGDKAVSWESMQCFLVESGYMAMCEAAKGGGLAYGTPRRLR